MEYRDFVVLMFGIERIFCHSRFPNSISMASIISLTLKKLHTAFSISLRKANYWNATAVLKRNESIIYFTIFKCHCFKFWKDTRHTFFETYFFKDLRMINIEKFGFLDLGCLWLFGVPISHFHQKHHFYKINLISYLLTQHGGLWFPEPNP